MPGISQRPPGPDLSSTYAEQCFPEMMEAPSLDKVEKFFWMTV
jgi:hypothetical protein